MLRDAGLRADRSELLEARFTAIQLTFLTADGREIARFERAGVTARIELPSTTMTAGSTMSGHVVVENNTGHEIRATESRLLPNRALRTPISRGMLWPLCAVPFTIPVGESTYPVTVMAAYATCGATPGPDFPKCSATGPSQGPPPLPPGVYQATLFQSSPVVSLPPPIDITVEPQSTP